jgi:CubicO group peptidase (beta-lactamase class C family)
MLSTEEGGTTLDAIRVEAEPKDVGLDAERLDRIEHHFKGYVDDGRLAGWLVAVARHGRVAYLATYGNRDIEAGLAIENDTLFRIYSMTKPVTSVAAMMLYEEGAFELTDPVGRFIPSFSETRVYSSGSSLAPVTEPSSEPMQIWHLLSHTSGLTYATNNSHPVDAMYRAEKLTGSTGDLDLATFCDRLGHVPVMFTPGTRWNYSVSCDVLGRVIEVASGLPLDEFFRRRIFEPLRMGDTSFGTPVEKLDRLAALYAYDPATGRAVRDDERAKLARSRPGFLSGGGGLVSSAADYNRFVQMLLCEGELDGVRLLGPRTLRYMTQNHLPGGVDLEEIGQRSFSETRYNGVGFGLGFSVVINPAKHKVLSSAGEFAWGGAASTAFWVDPKEQLTALFLTQLTPSSSNHIRPELKQLVYQSIVD